MKRTRKPTHPGAIIKADYLDPLDITQGELAERLGVTRKTVNKIVNERGPVTPDMALRLSRAFNTTPGLWLNLQKTYDLWMAENAETGWRDVSAVPGLPGTEAMT